MKKTLYVLACTLCTLLVLPAAAQVPSYVPTDGLVGWWPFNGNANDESGNGNDGVVNGATLTEDRFGNVDKAYGFDGVNNSIITPALLNASNDLTFSCWVNSNSESDQTIVNTIPHTVIGYGLNPWWAGSGNIGFLYGNGQSAGWSGDNNVIINPIPFLNTWVNHVIVKSGLHWKFLENNSLIYEFDSSGQPADIVAQLVFGHCDPSICAQTLSGSLDDIAIYNRALTEQEIQNLYTGTTQPPCVSLPSNLQQGLVGYWPFCGNANDESGNGNDGVVNGATLTEDRFGNANAAYGFDGVDDYIIGSADSLPTNDRTVSVWFFGNTIGEGDKGKHILGYGGNECGQSWLMLLDAWEQNTYEISGHCNANATYSSYGETQPNGSWHHMVASSSANGTYLYLDGSLIEIGASTFVDTYVDDKDFLFGAVPFNNGIGFYNDVYANPWDGSLDDIGIWNRALTPEEVQELYTLDACTFTVYDTLTVYETVYDTVYTYETIYDTVTTYVTVTDTLLIDITFVGFEGQPSWLNTVTVFPNPASDHITIDYGNFALMAGYNTIITDAAGATVYSSAVNSQQVEIDINAWGATGVYYMSVYDANGELVAVRHIVLE